MTRGVRWYLVSSLVLVALIVLAGCSHYLLAEREPWRHEAELACLNSGAVKETPERVRISAISGGGACGIDYPIRVSALGEGGPLGYDDEPLRPPGAIPNATTPGGTMPQAWPGTPSYSTPPSTVPASAPASYPRANYPQTNYPQAAYPPSRSGIQSSALPPAQAGAPPQILPPAQPLSLDPPGLSSGDDSDIGIPGGPPHPYYGGPALPPDPQSGLGAPAAEPPPLGPPDPAMIAAAGPVEVKPPATLACPIVSALDQWISAAVQPAAQRWFRQPVVEIKQISAYSCRGMNGNPNAHISEHAFGNALDIAEFDLADGHKISVQYGWHGSPEEQGFLHDVQLAACDQFTTVLAPGANVYHYNHIHVDLMRHYNGRHICEPSAIPGEVAAARARSRYAAEHHGDRYGDRYGDSGVTGSIKGKSSNRPLGYSGEDDDHLPEAVPGDD